MNRIKILSSGLQNQIAAGEVVERPASVVKELLENSLDAGASNVRVRVEQGGQALVEVIDNGSGMDPADMSLAVTRHATSKIFSLQDLLQVQSLGFRGEALPSIASVSQLYLASCEPDKSEGYFLEMLYGETLDQGPVAMSPGTRVRVQNLLANIPARLKFLKTQSTESKRCVESFVRTALAHLDVDMELVVDNRTVYRFYRDETLLDRLHKIWPEQICQGLREFHLEQSGFKVYGLASTPDNAQARGERMYFYVNTRAVKDKMLISSLRQAYQGRLLSREYPQAILFLEVPPEEVDVNVHPAKSEVRFKSEKYIFPLIVRAVSQIFEAGAKEGAEQFVSGTLDFSGQDFGAGVASRGEGYGRGKSLTETRPEMPLVQESIPREQEYVQGPQPEGAGFSEKGQMSSLEQGWGFNYLGQVQGTYLLFMKPDGRLLLIDQHGAHERILFEQTKQEQKSIQSRRLAVPVQMSLHPAEKKVLEDVWMSLRSLGFILELRDESHLDILGLPDFLPSREGMEALRSILGEKSTDLDSMLIMLACSTAIKAGQALTPDEATELAKKLMHCENMNFCPHGRPICLDLGSRELERLFKRR